MLNHLEAGRAANLRFGKSGEVFISLTVLNEEKNISENIEFLIDTGFNGFLQITEDIISRLQLDVTSKAKSRGFDGVEREVGITATKVRLLDQDISNFPIQITIPGGACLIGTSLLSGIKKMLIIDFDNQVITITGSNRVKKKVHKAVEKYS